MRCYKSAVFFKWGVVDLQCCFHFRCRLYIFFFFFEQTMSMRVILNTPNLRQSQYCYLVYQPEETGASWSYCFISHLVLFSYSVNSWVIRSMGYYYMWLFWSLCKALKFIFLFSKTYFSPPFLCTCLKMFSSFSYPPFDSFCIPLFLYQPLFTFASFSIVLALLSVCVLCEKGQGVSYCSLREWYYGEWKRWIF